MQKIRDWYFHKRRALRKGYLLLNVILEVTRTLFITYEIFLDGFL